MIRINLMPTKKSIRGRGDAGDDGSEGFRQRWLLYVAGAVLLEVVALLVVYKLKRDELTNVAQKSQELTATVDSIKRQISNHAEIKNQLKELRDREEAIRKLQIARSGPTSTMLELSRMLTPGRGPTIDRDKLEQLKRDNPTAVPNPNWDPRRLWVQSYKERERVVNIGGLARDGEDVSEFLRRLSLSDYFYEVRLLPASKSVDQLTKLELLKFEMSAKVRY